MEVFDLWMEFSNQYLRILMDQRESSAEGQQSKVLNEFKIRLASGESNKALDHVNLQQSMISDPEEKEGRVPNSH